MTARGGSALYSPELLALAVSLAECPRAEDAPCQGEARSRTCGGVIALSCALDEAGQIADVGLQVTACAVGQAAAALFAHAAEGRDRAAIARTRDELSAWLAADGPMPDWPGLAALEPARTLSGRHGAILLAWDAALAALPKETAGS